MASNPSEGVPVEKRAPEVAPTVEGETVFMQAPDPQGWATDVFGCMDDKYNCVDTALCGSCNAAAQFNKLFYGESGVHWPMCVAVGMTDFCLAACFGTPLASFAQVMIIRRQIRSRYHIGEVSAGSGEVDAVGSFFSDLCLTIFCTSCVLCQHHREMTLRGEWPGKCLFGRDPVQVDIEAPTAQYMV